ncbi:response regulator [Candidatus Enterococcus murrayae]|uniref:Response regulator transcription factor n=1 Tax=Candidatus Enterococcus murrayae TaxID=2815321 RepID=A0ABS3HP06_9ENTE|nr:response regulator transcription factor [Enterococcus sp. MJM16]
MNKQILLVEDDENYAEKLRRAIIHEGYDVTYLNTPIKAVAEFTKNNYDLVISDFCMKEMDGVKLLTILKEINPAIRSIILTAFPEEEVEMDAIDISVDHYLSKDKSLMIMLKYIHYLLEKEVSTEAVSSYNLSSTIEQITVDTKRRVVEKENEVVPLTKKEYDLLVLFLKNKGTALSREDIAEQLWSNDIENIDLRVIDGHIKRLRSKLSLFSISSVRGYGYKWSE